MSSKEIGQCADSLSSRYRSKPGYGLLEAAPNPMDRRFTIVRLAPSGRRLAERIAGMMEGGTTMQFIGVSFRSTSYE